MSTGAKTTRPGRRHRPGSLNPNYIGNLVDNWPLALDCVVVKLEAGATVAEVGCVCGSSTILMAKAYPNSTFVGSDPTASPSRPPGAADAGVGDRCHHVVSTAKDYAGGSYDLVASFDCPHDLGDPVGALAHVRQSLADDGTWMIVEPTQRTGWRTTSTRRADLLLRLNADLRARVEEP